MLVLSTISCGVITNVASIALFNEIAFFLVVALPVIKVPVPSGYTTKNSCIASSQYAFTFVK